MRALRHGRYGRVEVMPPIPSFDEFIYRHTSYQQYISIAVVLGAIVAVALVRYGRGRGLQFTPPLWLSLIVAAAVRLPLLWQDYWYDETFTSTITSGSWGRMWMVIQGDVHPPLYYFITKIVADTFGHTDVVMRLPALVAGLLIVWMMYQVVKLHGERVALWAAAITALLPAAVYYSSEARYPAALALALLVAYHAVMVGRFWRAGIALSVASLLHVNAWFYVALFCLVIVFQYRRLLPAVVACGAVLIWLPMAALQASDVADGFWLQQSTVIRYLVDMTITVRFPEQPLGLVLVTLVSWLAVMGAAVWRWRDRADGLWLLMVAVIPLVQWSIGVVWQPIYLERTMLVSALLLIIPVAHYITYHARPAVTMLAVLAVLAALASILTQDRSIADDVFAHCDETYITYAGNTYTGIQASHYRHDWPVLVAKDGNSTAQSLPDTARRRLWLLLPGDEIARNTCVVAQVDAYTTPEQYDRLSRITDDDRTILEVNQHAYWVVQVR